MKTQNFLPENQQEHDPVETPETGVYEPADNRQKENEFPLPEFVPILISVDSRKIESITKIYSQLCVDLNFLMSELGHLMDEKQPTSGQILNFLAAENPETFLELLYVETNNISFPGISTMKMIEFGLLEIPEQYLNDCEQARKSHALVWETIRKILRCNFEYPLISLFFVDPETGNYFDLDKKFHKTLKSHCSLFTQTPDQNIALEALQKICDGLNILDRMTYSGFNFRHGPTELNKLIPFINIAPNTENIVGFDSVLLWRSFRHEHVKEKGIPLFPTESTDLFDGFPRTRYLQKLIEERTPETGL